MHRETKSDHDLHHRDGLTYLGSTPPDPLTGLGEGREGEGGEKRKEMEGERKRGERRG